MDQLPERYVGSAERQDPYGALATWYACGRDVDAYLRLFEGVVPKMRGWEFHPNTGWMAAPSDHITNMTYDAGPGPTFKDSE